ncbi:gamma-glutamyltransferase family protein [Williamsia sterculiae]|uniref:Gamma-glutamyltranspeptidase / glutathione hydrolase n=1 Tax=Williamsia sterculiae TaxID=1344003 RepID=A0A1N7EPR7_9NOCA|nr:gamma-glutamyltransferase family protein [Williamsia sterculiae]SIR90029.1 gamma-glutamyltranspeptidase / glutathione hydrolase [Williamsia sterculiae]
MVPTSRTRALTVAVATVLGLTAVACDDTVPRSGAEGGTCATVPNGTPVVAAASADGSSRDIATNPEVAAGYRDAMTPVHTTSFAVVTANPLATQAACEVVRDGGSAADGVVAAQAVLGLVEPQATGIGGGAFLVYYDAASKTLRAYDGRETAPAAATGDYLRYISPTDHRSPMPSARASGRSIGTPGVLRMLQLAQSEHGDKRWRDLFTSAIRLADNGFDISPRMAAAIADSRAQLAVDADARAYFLNADGSPKTAGTRLTNPAYAKTLGAVAGDGADAFYTGSVARDIVDAIGSTEGGVTPGLTTVDDLAGYTARTREALCTPYRTRILCGMPPPSSGGIAVAATMGILSNFDLASLRPDRIDRNGGIPQAEAVHLVSGAERLAYADRDEYVADADFVPLPGGSPAALTDPNYLKQRASSINPDRSMGEARPGDFPAAPGSAAPTPEHGTSQVVVVDKKGDAATMTTTVESAFGSFHMVDGFILNNQLTDFSSSPVDSTGKPVANRVEAGKRPRSAMSPTLLFARQPDGSRGELVGSLGSPGGSVIIQFVVKTLINLLDWGLDPQQAVSGVDFGAANTPVTNVGGEHPGIDTANDGADDPLVRGLRARGHQVSVADQSSGLAAVIRDGTGYVGGADPRREGEVMGDPVR